MELKYILVVSGLPRSGTSLMMQMLQEGGIEIVADNVRAADADNPRGYYELERAKKIKQDSSWLPATRGKAFKIVSQLLYDLPATETYRIIFMERDLDEMITSQGKMLERLGRSAPPREKIKHAYVLHLERLHEWLSRQPNIARLRVNHGDLLGQPELQARRVHDFLGGRTDAGAMVRAVEPSLHRNRTTPAGTGAENVAGTSA